MNVYNLLYKWQLSVSEKTETVLYTDVIFIEKQLQSVSIILFRRCCNSPNDTNKCNGKENLQIICKFLKYGQQAAVQDTKCWPPARAHCLQVTQNSHAEGCAVPMQTVLCYDPLLC